MMFLSLLLLLIGRNKWKTLSIELDILSKPYPCILDILDQVEDEIKWSSSVGHFLSYHKYPWVKRMDPDDIFNPPLPHSIK